MEKPIKAFLKLFEVEEKREYSKREFEYKIDIISKRARRNTLDTLDTIKNCVKSAPYNTFILRNIQRKTSHNEGKGSKKKVR